MTDTAIMFSLAFLGLPFSIFLMMRFRLDFFISVLITATVVSVVGMMMGVK